MKVKVRKWPHAHPATPALDAFILWQVGRMPGECFERIALKQGKEHWLYRPSHHGEHCPSSGDRPGIECRCDNCDHFLVCFPDYNDPDHKYTYGDHRDFWRPTVREETCLACKHREHGAELARRFRCKKTKRVGKELRALRCPYFEKDVSNEQ